MHVVAAHRHDVQRAEQTRDRKHRDHERASAGSLPFERTDERDIAADRNRKCREPQRVRTRGIEEVRPPASPPDDRALLGDRGARNEAAVVAHSEQLIAEWQRDHCRDEARSIARSVGAPLADDRDDQEQDAEEHQLGPYQPAQAEDHHLVRGAAGASRTGPRRRGSPSTRLPTRTSAPSRVRSSGTPTQEAARRTPAVRTERASPASPCVATACARRRPRSRARRRRTRGRGRPRATRAGSA